MNDSIAQLARRAVTTAPASGRRLSERLRPLSLAISHLYQRLGAAPADAIATSRAAEWLLDNYHIVQRALRSLREEFPPGFERRLPTLTDGNLQGYPVAYALANEITRIAECHLDLDLLGELVGEFQSIRPLSIAEVWALPALLRLSVLEHLAKAAASIVLPLEAAPDTDSVLSGQSVEGAAEVSLVASCVRSVRVLETANWKEFFESVNETERALRQDPAGIYPRMDFETRDRYRKVVEELALRTRHPEDEIARRAVRLARAGSTPRTTHVGYYFIDGGFEGFARSLAYRPGWRAWWRQLLRRHPTSFYLGTIALLTLIAETALTAALLELGTGPLLIVIAVMLALIPASTIGVSVTNGIVTRTLPARVLPKMDFSDGIPTDCQTAVAVPALLIDSQELDSLLHALEIRYLANQDRQLQFVLLTDFSDAQQSSLPGDAELLKYASERLGALNAKYGDAGIGPFHLLHRDRRWSAAEGCWLGWERKRGKLSAFNRLITGDRQAGFSTHVGNPAVLASIRFVIVLDADTELPRGAARRLIATLAHPLNHAEFDGDSATVISGYTILQPRVEISPVSAEATGLSRLFSGDTGLDPYTHAVSDVYQDLFGEGIYVGKGIYEVSAFQRSLAGTIPPGALLSHDLFEGIHGRAGLVTDIMLLEDYPAHYLAYTRRLHRWARGDWQLLPWLRRRVPLADGSGRNRLSLISKWKLLDNLRRSLLEPSILLFLVVAWFGLPQPLLLWTALVLAVPSAPGLTDLTGHLASAAWSNLSGSLAKALTTVRAALGFWFFEIIFLPHQAAVLCDAVVRTLFRLCVTRRHLLEWTPAAYTARGLAGAASRATVWREMALAPAIATVAALALWFVRPAALFPAAPLLLLWLMSPEIALFISAERTRPVYVPNQAEERRLRILARRTWAFFETFDGPDDQWLPPDHFQEDPRGIVARRTSPTNIGLVCVAAISAYDLGYRGLLWTALRLKNTFDTMQRLERYRGHFLNWYRTSDLEPLLPRYVSTVDSGNLVGCLWIVQRSCREFADAPVMREREWDGLLDTLTVLLDEIEGAVQTSKNPLAALTHHVEGMLTRIRRAKDKPLEWPATAAELLTESCPTLERHLVGLVSAPGAVDAKILTELQLWSAMVRSHAERLGREMELLAPWLAARARPPRLLQAAQAPDELATVWAHLQALPVLPTLIELPDLCAAINAELTRLRALVETRSSTDAAVADLRAWCDRFANGIEVAQQTVRYLSDTLLENERRAELMSREADFSLLYDKRRRLMFIGYNVTASKLDENHYDLLASEARLASFIAVAKGDVPEEHWLHLGRPIGRVSDRSKTLLSWNGTMFEYLMPTLLMRDAPDTLIGRSCQAAVREQIAYARRRGVPWGISESAYYGFDADRNYQYRAFGVPALGYKRGLEEDLVVTPYAAVLALRFDPQAVLDDLEQFRQLGVFGRYGFYDSIDFTPRHLPAGQRFAVIRTFMAHHQGMTFAALNNFLSGDPLVGRFHAEPLAKTAETLLWERPAPRLPVESTRPRPRSQERPARRRPVSEPWSVRPDSPSPQVHVLSNGRYGVVVTEAGGGFSRWKDLALTRWVPDTTLDDMGFRIYIRDLQADRWWSVFRPAASTGEASAIIFHPHMVEMHGRHEGISIRETIAVAPNADLELRHVTLTNEGRRRRQLVLTSYAEVVLEDPVAARRHPAFSKLFVHSQYLREQHALTFYRRPRLGGEPSAHLIHMLVLPHSGAQPAGFESARDRFLGRGHTPRSPAVMQARHWRLSGTDGDTLDPIMALAARIDLPAHATLRLAYVTVIAGSRREALDLAMRHRSLSDLEWMLELAESHGEEELAQLNVHPRQLPILQRLLSLLFYPDHSLRAPTDVLARNRLGQSGLWKYAISGDVPILLVRMYDADNTALVHELLRGQAFWRARGVTIDLVILNERTTGYSAELDDRLMRTVAGVGAEFWLHRSGGVFLLRADQVSEDDRILLMTAARVILDSSAGSVAEQLGRVMTQPAHLPPLARTATVSPSIGRVQRPGDLLLDNGFGGFSADGREYVIHLEPGECTPAPWVNVIANPRFGFVISESGGGYTWAENSSENRLTPWRNDVVADEPGEALYLRDEETGEVWSPTPVPARGPGSYQIRHGAGYTTFHHQCHDLEQELRMFAPVDTPVKIIQLSVTNHSNRPRRVTVTYYAEWVLGTTRDVSAPYIIAEFDPDSEILTARNPWNGDFAETIGFMAASQKLHGFTSDRTEFLGRHGDPARPAALSRLGLANTVRPGIDPCAALQVHLDLQPGDRRQVHFLFGQGRDRDEAFAIVRKFRDVQRVESSWDSVQQHWNHVLGARTARTPDPALNLMLNRWLLYQALVSRIWARTGYYQSSGAFGFRDQLQDVMALLHVMPDLGRAHILDSARHQFAEGDVLHWWHPPAGPGIRTRCADDLLWLPFVTAHYVATTGDEAILRERIPFLRGEPLRADEVERYARFTADDAPAATLYEHCLRAIEQGRTIGPHGLPLFGTGDWNDGMNRVGALGRGESVWLGWFLCATLKQFAAICTRMNDTDHADEFVSEAERLRRAIETVAWDGQWYRRGYYDDGRPLGSAQRRECRIDSVAQSWSVLSTAGDPHRCNLAMQAVRRHLIREADGLILLLTPPFSGSDQDPGYVRAYPPGVRENGGQYTHAALWVIWALAELGEGDRAAQLFRQLLPIARTHTRERAKVYRVEPYVIAADVYSVEPHAGRGGWTWYTGSAGWAYRFGWESLLGLRQESGGWRVDPCIPQDWPGFEVTVREGDTEYEIRVENPSRISRGVAVVTIDGVAQTESFVPRMNDGIVHHVEVVLEERLDRVRSPAAS